jgi:hypothetical protein
LKVGLGLSSGSGALDAADIAVYVGAGWADSGILLGSCAGARGDWFCVREFGAQRTALDVADVAEDLDPRDEARLSAAAAGSLTRHRIRASRARSGIAGSETVCAALSSLQITAVLSSRTVRAASVRARCGGRRSWGALGAGDTRGWLAHPQAHLTPS